LSRARAVYIRPAPRLSMTPNAIRGRKWYRQNKARAKQNAAGWQRANPEKCRGYRNKYKAKFPRRVRRATRKSYQKRRVRCIAWSQQWQRDHPDRARETNRRFRVRNRKRLRRRNHEWRRENPEKARENDRRRYVRLAGAEGSHSVGEFVALCELYGGHCLRCGRTRRKLTEDHIIPLSKGGSDWLSNMQPLCGPCNTAKKDRMVDYRPWRWFALERASRRRYERGWMK
jgi:5-methylcytosine-specific restriction endonuclease McrA